MDGALHPPDSVSFREDRSESERQRADIRHAKGGQEQRSVQLRLVPANEPRYPNWLQPQIIAPKRVARAAYFSVR
jgi:hypothetical protein